MIDVMKQYVVFSCSPNDEIILINAVYFQPYNVLAHPIKQAKAAGLRIESKVMDVSNVDVSNAYAFAYH